MQRRDFIRSTAAATGITLATQSATAEEENKPADNKENPSTLRFGLMSVMVNDQDKALKFYTQVLGFVKKHDVPAGGGRWITVVSAKEPDGVELLLEPLGFAPAKTFQAELKKAGIPLASFAAGDVQKEYERLTKLGVTFTLKPTKYDTVTLAAFDDTVGNIIQLMQT